MGGVLGGVGRLRGLSVGIAGWCGDLDMRACDFAVGGRDVLDMWVWM